MRITTKGLAWISRWPPGYIQAHVSWNLRTSIFPPRVSTANSGSRDQQLVGLDSVLMDLTSPLPICPFPGDNVPVP